MGTKASPIETFNFVSGLIFVYLLRSFPMNQRITSAHLPDSFEDILELPPEYHPRANEELATQNKIVRGTNTEARRYLSETTDWLVSEGFLRRAETANTDDEFQLSLKAIEVLGKKPDGLKEPLGSKLAEAVQETGGEVRRAAVSEVVGTIFGAAARAIAQS